MTQSDNRAAPERIWAAAPKNNCVVCFDEPSLDYNIEYIRKDIAEAEKQAAVVAMREAAIDACDDYPRAAPDETEWPHYDDQIQHSQAGIRDLPAPTDALDRAIEAAVTKAVLAEREACAALYRDLIRARSDAEWGA